ncbi:unnamed protein product [Amoebophrya sp. A120]|nr:unnamed protein product [Amoebophrya sp. A120]|eukprot:GSA120T00024674001.1
MFASLLSFGLQEEEKEAEERKKQELAKKPKLRGRECPGAEHIVARMEVEREASYAYTFPCPENGYQVMRRPQSRAKIAGVKLPKIRGEDQTTPLPPQTVEEQKCPGAAHIRKKMEMEKKAINALKTPCPQNNYSVYIDGNAMQAKLRAKEKLLAKQMKEKTSSGPRPALRSKPEVVFSAQIEKSVLEKSLAEMETAVKKLEVESNKSGEEEEEDDLDFGMISSYGGVRRSKASGTTGTAPHVAGSGRVAAKRVAVRGAAASAESDNEGSNMDEWRQTQ